MNTGHTPGSASGASCKESDLPAAATLFRFLPDGSVVEYALSCGAREDRSAMPADLQRARELFLHAVGKLPPQQWGDYVAAACGPDTDLCRQVEHFLEVHREAGSFLERPAEGLKGTAPFTPAPADAATTPDE